MSKFEILFSHIHNLSAKHLSSQFSVKATDLYALFIGLGWLKPAHSFVTAACLRAESDPRVNINMAFLGQQLHYWAPAWWTRPLLLWREKPNTERVGEMERWEEWGYRISGMMKWGEGMRECEWRILAWGWKGKRSDQINHQPTDNWTSCTQGMAAAPWKVTLWFVINSKRRNGNLVPFGLIPGMSYLTRWPP